MRLAGEIAVGVGEIFTGLAAHLPVIETGAGAGLVFAQPHAGPGGAERGSRYVILVAGGGFGGAGGVDRAEGAGEGLVLRIGEGGPGKTFR